MKNVIAIEVVNPSMWKEEEGGAPIRPYLEASGDLLIAFLFPVTSVKRGLPPATTTAELNTGATDQSFGR